MPPDLSTSSHAAEIQARPIRFWRGGHRIELDGVPPALTVLEWLRDASGCHAAKEGCAEGDCGACTVAVTDLDGEGQVRVRAVNACIQPVGALDGKLLATAEDIGMPG
ncbi:2Fe-2S iron-sulfur cluster-binding protein, partial [Shinella sp.]|uniref:2Fe-2S iron-sulfur cluster-binding protein n=1 Tax=Shinella sp. TaxID=1870904 RepID=UPI0029A5BDEE